VFEFASRFDRRKAPVDSSLGRIAPLFPGGNLAANRLLVSKASVQTLRHNHRELDFCIDARSSSRQEDVMAKLLVGPVIGKVTDTSARALVETDQVTDVTLTATSPDGTAIQVSKQVQGHSPTGFQLMGLQPATEYQLLVSGVTAKRNGRIKTFPIDPDRMNVAVVSCNFTIQKGETDLWADLRDRYVSPGDIDMVFHMGDQVYGDEAFTWAMNELDGRTKGTAAQERRIMERYRDLYRLTWNYDETADVLASVPNVMIWDDHDIRNSWGSRSEDKDKNKVEHYIGTLGRRVFREYQRQLWDPDATNPPADGFEHHFHVWGRIGALFVDQRGGRSFQYDSARPYLGTPQWNDIEQAITSGVFSQCNVLLVVTSVPLAYMGLGITKNGTDVIEDLMDHWALPAHQKEQVEFLRLLRRWKQQEQNREVLILGGDVHLGGNTDIKHNGLLILKQLISSPITNKPPTWFESAVMRGLLEMNEDLGDSYSFEHRDFTRKRNFGVVLVRTPPGQMPFIGTTLVTS
jgi:hypothetical protein